MASLFDAINAAAAALSANAETTESRSNGTTEARVKPRVQPKSATSGTNPEPRTINPEPKKVQPKGKKPTANVNDNGNGNHEPLTINHEPESQPSDIKHQTSQKPKTDSPKTKGGASYVIPKEFKQAIENYLKGRADMKAKLSAKGKTIDGCCDYIFDVMRKRAEKNRGGKSAVGMYVDPNEIFGLAVHYYDESDSALRSESEE